MAVNLPHTFRQFYAIKNYLCFVVLLLFYCFIVFTADLLLQPFLALTSEG